MCAIINNEKKNPSTVFIFSDSQLICPGCSKNDSSYSDVGRFISWVEFGT